VVQHQRQCSIEANQQHKVSSLS